MVDAALTLIIGNKQHEQTHHRGPDRHAIEVLQQEAGGRRSDGRESGICHRRGKAPFDVRHGEGEGAQW